MVFPATAANSAVAQATCPADEWRGAAYPLEVNVEIWGEGPDMQVSGISQRAADGPPAAMSEVFSEQEAGQPQCDLREQEHQRQPQDL